MRKSPALADGGEDGNGVGRGWLGLWPPEKLDKGSFHQLHGRGQNTVTLTVEVMSVSWCLWACHDICLEVPDEDRLSEVVYRWSFFFAVLGPNQISCGCWPHGISQQHRSPYHSS